MAVVLGAPRDNQPEPTVETVNELDPVVTNDSSKEKKKRQTGVPGKSKALHKIRNHAAQDQEWLGYGKILYQIGIICAQPFPNATERVTEANACFCDAITTYKAVHATSESAPINSTHSVLLKTAN